MGNASRKRRNVETAIAVCVGGLGSRCRSGEIGSNARCAGSRVVAPLTAEPVVACIRGGVRCISSTARCVCCKIGRYLLTGTPVANKPEDLWSQILFLDDGHALGSTFEQFRATYCTGRTGYRNIPQLRTQVASLALRRTKGDALRLPEKRVKRIGIELAPRQRTLYDRMRNELAVWVRTLTGTEILEQADAILERMIRLAQLASNPGLLDASYEETPAKFAALDALLASYTDHPDRKVIIWTSFVENVITLAARYPNLCPVKLYGEMDTASRNRAVQAFRRDSKVRLLVANPAAGREGLTLTEANVAIYLDRTFNLVDYLQSQDRIHRISQNRECEVILLIANSTIDEFIDYSLEQKNRLAQFTQSDTNEIALDDLALRKPDMLRALLKPRELGSASAPDGD